MGSISRKLAKKPAVNPPQMQQLLRQLTALAPELQGMENALQELQGLQNTLCELQANLAIFQVENQRLRYILSSFVGEETLKRLEAEFDAAR
jgi:hypothetical protein